MRKILPMGSWVCCAALAGCDRVEVATAVAAIDICNDFTCENSHELLYRGFHGFRRSGEPNEQGMTMWSDDGRPQLYDHSGNAWDLDVVGGRIIGRRGSDELSGKDLRGAEIIIDQENEPPFAIHIDDVHTIAFPFGDAEPLDAYTLSRRALDEEPHPFEPDRRLCNRMVFPGEDRDGFLGLEPDQAVVFAGDFYDIHLARTSCDPDWINFGCAGHTLAKLLLTRNTCESQEQPPDASEKQLEHERQATLKLLVADYCDIGAHFTVSGQPLVWKGGLVADFATAPTTIEARWDENGALCLTIPRLEANPAPGSDFPPNIWDAIVDRCGAQTPPPCANQDPGDFDGALRVSANRLAP